MSQKYETVIGLEVHAELRTDSKLFCGCSTKFGADPNGQTCPVCLGMPGALPVLNKKAVDYAIEAGLALNCEIQEYSKFDRKHYFYPDLPKAYQCSQFDFPLCKNGKVTIHVNGVTKDIGINRIHLEEEAGKSVHSGDNILGSDYSLEDFNRGGIPLIEIVSEPDMRSPEEAYAYLTTLKSILQYTGVSDCKMEEGSLRCDANISLRPVGSTEFGTKVELKNLNSFRAVQKALEYEQQRQARLLDKGEPIIQETRHWDETTGKTHSMRTKEQADDYRYFPDPDLVPLIVSPEWIEEVRARLPELPPAKFERFVREYGLPEYDANLIIATKAQADFFEATVALYNDPKTVSNWMMGELTRLLKTSGQEIEDCKVTPELLAKLLTLVDNGTISGTAAKSVLEEVFATGKDPELIVQEKGLAQISDTAELEKIVAAVIAANPASVEDYRNGKDKALGFLVGQVMKETKGRANPKLVNELLRKQLS
ncbi:MAG: Asp-tRNA(Asn)/Glu-tRNA(Gln) amidotransferase subunit GatB [Firmicutes bacterium]|nr:Asp-tRNA(Asn)/Glu-tRNA(Gln) amidotransferase subunit GatB [Bacillota bacterium]